MLDLCKAYGQHHGLTVPDSYATFKDLKVLAQHMMTKMMQDIPKPVQD